MLAHLQQALKDLDSGQIDRADEVLSRLLLQAPTDPDVLQLLGIVRRMQGKFGEAESLYRRSLSVAPGQAHVHHNLGNLLRSMGQLEEAAAAQREAIRLKQNYIDAHLSLALALSELGDHEAAAKSCRTALRLQPQLLPAAQLLIAELNALDRPKEAESLARRALAAKPGDPRQVAILEHNLAMALKQQERFDEALLLFAAAQMRDPDLAAVDYNRANTLFQLGRVEESAQAFGQAVTRNPTHIEAIANHALASALVNDFSTARQRANQALAADPDNSIALIASAIVDAEQGAFAGAQSLLRRIMDDPRNTADRQVSFSLGFAADALERQGKCAHAFEIYKASNVMRRASQFGAVPSRVADEIARLQAFFSTCDAWTRSERHAPGRSEPAEHIFILGFMRSGTTLLQTVLSTDPNVVSIDEVEFLTNPAREFLLTNDGLGRLERLSPSDAENWRSRYWKSVSEAGFSVESKVFIDKMPFNSLRLPLIARLFPDAKVIFAVRDPRDVVISCFRRRFSPTSFSYEFMDLTDCANFYASTMKLTELYRSKLPLDIHEHRYENMIDDFDTTIASACRFGRINWSPTMRDFSSEARRIDRRSASADQVRRGLYGDGAGQWRLYREELREVSHILDPWITHFGYTVD
ncbi:MAG: sulfotransferase [Rhizomicrobium sp.]